MQSAIPVRYTPGSNRTNNNNLELCSSTAFHVSWHIVVNELSRLISSEIASGC
jgi:hypothetical protein